MYQVNKSLINGIFDADFNDVQASPHYESIEIIGSVVFALIVPSTIHGNVPLTDSNYHTVISGSVAKLLECDAIGGLSIIEQCGAYKMSDSGEIVYEKNAYIWTVAKCENWEVTQKQFKTVGDALGKLLSQDSVYVTFANVSGLLNNW